MERIITAVENNTLPQFIYKIGQEWRNYEYDVIYINLINPIQWAREINMRADPKLTATSEELMTFFLLSNQKVQEFFQQGNLDQLALLLNLSDDEARMMTFLYFKVYNDKERAQLIDEILKERAIFKAQYASEKEEYDMYRTSVPWTITKFVEISKSMVYRARVNNTLLGILDQILPTQDVPLISTENYYKIIRDYKGQINYPDEEGVLFMYIDGERVTVQEDADTFEAPTFTITLLDSVDILSKVKILLSPESVDLLDRTSNGTFNLLSMNTNEPLAFNKVVMADIIMNNSIFSEEFVIDEHIRATKYQSTLYVVWIKDEYRMPFVLSGQFEYNTETKKQDYTILVRVSNVSRRLQLLDNLMIKLATLFGYYTLAAPKIMKIYNQLLTIPIDLTPIIPTQFQQKNLQLEMFPKGYSRACQYKPRIIDAAEAKELEEKYQVMAFPKDVPNPLFFVCDNQDQHVYTGLLSNKLINKDKYPFLPCCYKQDQRNKKSKFKLYYEEGKTDIPAGLATRFLITEKIVKFNQTGKLPSKLEEFFNLCGSPQVIRRGVSRGASSIIDCILTVMNVNYAKKSEQERVKNVARIRQLLANNADLNLCRQETWNLSIAQVKNLLSSENFMDASMFFSLLEQTFSCRLVIFTKTDFKLPYFSHGFISGYSNPKWPIIVLYENIGGEAQHADYPQYELIQGVENIEYIYTLYRSSLSTYVVVNSNAQELYNKPLGKATLNLTLIGGQYIDAYGKVYALSINVKEHKSFRTFFLKYPIAPLGKYPVLEKIIPIERAPINGTIYNTRIGFLEGYFELQSIQAPTSYLNEFLQARAQVKLIVENAKYIKSKYGAIIYENRNEKFSDKKWIDKSVLPIPSNEFKKRLEYTLNIFEKQESQKLAVYKNLKYIPYSYDSVLDFKKDERFIVSETGSFSPPEENFNLRKVTCAESTFFTLIEPHIYYCNQIPQLPSDVSFNLYLYNTREKLTMYAALFDILAVKIDDKILFYKMDKVK